MTLKEGHMGGFGWKRGKWRGKWKMFQLGSNYKN